MVVSICEVTISNWSFCVLRADPNEVSRMVTEAISLMSQKLQTIASDPEEMRERVLKLYDPQTHIMRRQLHVDVKKNFRKAFLVKFPKMFEDDPVLQERVRTEK